ncbi:hypothetical protein NUU61_000543 [Penicillium alfredii]|uniref:Myb-like domain-containing protein n=1 Tax=Penicillium alfredii TaxID=1506179 RepID=A0A9W9GA76_9EURO|nr:uncharacterized protein NUU61_000543 [Penicillium alfredii]KAJ5114784.1 hypothetical protein NUU61_000543 [Penicillium alfredii]
MARVAAGPTAVRRVTRSQSRELEDPSHGDELSLKTPSRDLGKGKSNANRLSVVAEESPATSRQTSASRLWSPMVPESPGFHEGQTNISGTTFLAHGSDSEDGEPDPALMGDALPDLQRAATTLMTLLVPQSSNPINIVKAAKQLNDPKNTQSKRLKRAGTKLLEDVKVYSHQTYIDVAEVSRLVPTVAPRGTAQPWTPLPILHKANCARLALDVLLTSIGTQAPAQTIRNLENKFPAPFVGSFVAGSSPRAAGTSATKKATFELALEIRTQFLIMELERRQGEKDFDPSSIMKGVFYDELTLDGENSEIGPASLRGFKLAGIFEDANGCLPEEFQDDVGDRISELDYELLDDDGAPNIKGLKGSYPWGKFMLRATRWIQKRDSEINEDLQRQPRFDQVQSLLEGEIQRRSTSELPAARESTAPRIDNRGTQESPLQDNRDTHVVNRTPQLHQDFDAAVPRPEATPQGPIPQLSQASPVKEPPRDPNRRKSSKIRFLNSNSMDVLKKREETRRQQDLSNLESQPTGRSSNAAGGDQQRFLFPSWESIIAGSRREKSPSRGETSRPHNEIPQSPEPRFPDYGDDSMFNHDEELDLGRSQRNEVLESTSPPGSARINQVSHNGRFFDSPRRTRGQGPSTRPAFIDRQINATRVSPVSQDTDPQSAERRQAQVNALQSRKRAREESPDFDSDSDSDSDDFDQDGREIDISDRRAQKPQQTRPVDKRPRNNDSPASGAGDQLQQSLVVYSQPAPNQSPRAVEVHSPPEPVSSGAPPSSQSRWTVRNVPGAGIGLPARPMTKKYSQEEDDRLIRLIESHGTKWAQIKREDELCPPSDGGPKLHYRTQVNLKDRARNLKIKFLREGLPLPANFDRVLGPKA